MRNETYVRLELIMAITWLIVGVGGYVVAYYKPEERFSCIWTGSMLLGISVLNFLSWSKNK